MRDASQLAELPMMVLSGKTSLALTVCGERKSHGPAVPLTRQPQAKPPLGRRGDVVMMPAPE